MRADARRVVVAEPRRIATRQGNERDYLGTTFRIEVTNNGDEPIRNVQVSLDIEPRDPNAMPENDTLHQQLSQRQLMGGTNFWHAEFVVQLKHDASSHLGSATIPTYNRATVSFIDSAGYLRQRTWLPELVLLAAPDTIHRYEERGRREQKSNS